MRAIARRYFVRLLWQGKQSARRLGSPAVAAIILILGCLAVAPVLLSSLRHAADAARHETQTIAHKLQQERANKETVPTPAEQLANFYARFPKASEAPNSIQKIYDAAAAHNLVLEQGEYHLSHDTGGKLDRYEITLPIKGNYLQVRKFINQVLTDNSNIALNSISFQRQKVAETTIQSQVKFLLFLGEGT